MREPRIKINGVELTEAQSMALRVAAGKYVQEMIEKGLGEDERGRSMAALYALRLREVEALMRAGR